LSNLVSGLLDGWRMAAGQLQLHRQELDLAALVAAVLDRFRDEAALAGCELRAKLTPVVGWWDGAQLGQAIGHLLSNSVRYAPRAPIQVAVEPAGEAAIVTVEDEGIGIQPDDARRIFERFERGVSARHYGGLGLGLYLVRGIVEAHGGTVAVDSRPGAGARFTLCLPRGAPAEERVDAAAPSS
jgi:signal transduction histidine kinase